MKIKFYFFLFFILTISSAKALTFNNFFELDQCVNNYNSFTEYKQNLQNCFKNQNIIIEENSLKVIKNNSGIIDNIIKIKYPKEEIEKKNSLLRDIFFTDEKNKKIKFSLENKNFIKLNRYIKKNPRDIYALTEDINKLTYNDKLISEFKRREIFINIYNSFKPELLNPKISKNLLEASTPTNGMAAIGLVGVAALGALGGGSGSGDSGPATLSLSVSTTTVAECDSAINITGTLTKAHSSNVTITYTLGGTATNTVDYNLSSTTSTISAGSTTGTVTLTPVNDTTNETSETITLSADVTGVSTTGNTSTTITLYDYVLKCNATAYSEGTSSAQNTIKNRSSWTGVNADSNIHPYEQMNIHKVHSFTSGVTSLTGVGQVIHIHDSRCSHGNHIGTNHEIFANKTIVNLDDGGAGEATFSIADSSNHGHCNGVATFAAGDINADSSGVAPDADLVLSDLDNVVGSTFSHWADDLDSARANNAVASNNSWGFGGTNNNVSEVETFRSANGFTASEAWSSLWLSSTTASAVATWDEYIQALLDFQQSGVMVWSAANTVSESDASGMAGLPFWYDGTKHATDLSKAWLSVNVTDYSGDADLSNAVESEFTLKGNKCGSTAAYCLTVDGYDLNPAIYVDGASSEYDTDASTVSWGSSWSAPMVSGGIALVSQAFPNHTPEQIVDRILASANNVFFTPTGNTTFTTHGASIQHGYHSDWGHGVPDFYAAMSPITTSSNVLSFGSGGSGSGGSGGSGSGGAVPFSQIKKHPVSSTSILLSSSIGDSVSNGLSDKTTYAYDALNGGFKFKLSNFITNEKTNNQKIEYNLNSELYYLNNFTKENSTIIKNDLNFYSGEYFNFRDKYNKGLSITLNQPNIALQNFNHFNSNNYQNVFLSENKGVGLNQKFNLFENNILLGYNNSKFNLLTDINNDHDVPLETLALSLNVNSDKFDILSFTTGLLKEENTFLLSKGTGAFGINSKDNLSKFYGLNLFKKFDDMGDIHFSTIIGNSRLNNSENSFIIDTSKVLSSSFEFVYKLKNLFDNDEFNISISQPNRVEKGEMTFGLLGLADKNGILPYEKHTLSLTPSGRQKDLILSYYRNHSKNFKTGFKSIITDDLGHYKNSNLDTNFIFSASLAF